MKSVTSTIMMRVAFGKRYQDRHERKQVLRFLNEVQALMADFFVSDIWSSLPFVCLLMNVLVGGTDTSAATVVWAMTALIKNPKVMKRAQEEVRNVVGKKGRVDVDDLRKLTYLKAVVKEIMRLYPPVPLLLPRETTKDVILQGYKIKAKTVVFVNALAIGRDPESWESPEEFLPERFLGSDIDFKGNDFELIPFGAGRRICPGISVGVATVDLLLANLLYLFDWGLPNGMTKEDIDFDAMPGIIMHKRSDLCLLAHVYL
ncbi:hypothetical protein L1887_39264 [Cichorium endivia]|nr:hypothetical protein L1887_39264 [Cichorium endivia]